MKIKNIFSFSIICLMFISSCNKVNSSSPSNIIVTFKDYDDSLLYYEKIPYGSIANYGGKKPFRDATESKIYTFVGWDKTLNQNLYENTTFIAKYTEENKKFIVTFKNYNGEILQQSNVEYGNVVNYKGVVPIKKSDDDHVEYKFSHWDKPIDTYIIKEDTTFIAQFETTEYVFATFINYDDTQLYKTKIVKGSIPNYNGVNPQKKYDGVDKAYKFIGWDKSINNIYDDTVFKAQFDLLNIYSVVFKNYDGTILQTTKVISGDNAVYTGVTPRKDSTTSGDYKYIYRFSGWSDSITNITKNMEVTAKFTCDVIAIGQTAIKNHLDINGSGNYHNVTTGEGSTLGYSGSSFYVSYSSSNQNIYSVIAITFTYGFSSGTALFEIYDDSTLMYKASMNVYTANHKYYSMDLIKIYLTKYTTSQQASYVATLSILAAKLAVDDASDYLLKNNLSYIY